MSAKEIYVRILLCAFRDNHFGSEVSDLDEGYDLVERTFGVKLNLAVLIGYAQGFDRGLTGINLFAGKSVALPRLSAQS